MLTVPAAAATVAPLATVEKSVGEKSDLTSVPAPAPPVPAVTAVAIPSIVPVVSVAEAAIETPPAFEETLPLETLAPIVLVSVLVIFDMPIDPPYIPPATATAVTLELNSAALAAVIATFPPAARAALPSTSAETELLSVLVAIPPPAASAPPKPAATAAAAAKALAVRVSVACAAIVRLPGVLSVPPEA